MYHQWSEILCGEHAMTSFRPVPTSTARKYIRTHCAQYALWECPMATNVWAMTQGRLQKCGVVAQSFYRLTRQLEERLTGEEMETWATVAWSIWNARNRFCFEEKQSQPKDILQAATTLVQDYQRWNRQLAEPC